MQQKPKIDDQRLIALWAFSESGLGGIMHAFKIPFTGFVLGAVSLLIMALIARNNIKVRSAIIEATLLVLLVKFMVSPQSPPGAYIAVAFQGLTGAILFSLFGVNSLSTAAAGLVCMVESALQKIITTTLLFGQNIWTAIDLFFKSILKDLNIAPTTNFSWLIIIFYVGVYGVWGIIAGIYANRFSKNLEARSPIIINNIQQQAIAQDPTITQPKKSPIRKWIWIIAGLVIMILIFLFTNNDQKIGFIIMRTLAAVLVIYFVLNPLVKWAMAKFFAKNAGSRSAKLQHLINDLPAIRANIQPAMGMAKTQSKGIGRLFHFLENFIILSLYR